MLYEMIKPYSQVPAVLGTGDGSSEREVTARAEACLKILIRCSQRLFKHSQTTSHSPNMGISMSSSRILDQNQDIPPPPTPRRIEEYDEQHVQNSLLWATATLNSTSQFFSLRGRGMLRRYERHCSIYLRSRSGVFGDCIAEIADEREENCLKIIKEYEELRLDPTRCRPTTDKKLVALAEKLIDLKLIKYHKTYGYYLSEARKVLGTGNNNNPLVPNQLNRRYFTRLSKRLRKEEKWMKNKGLQPAQASTGTAVHAVLEACDFVDMSFREIFGMILLYGEKGTVAVSRIPNMVESNHSLLKKRLRQDKFHLPYLIRPLSNSLDDEVAVLGTLLDRMIGEWMRVDMDDVSNHNVWETTQALRDYQKRLLEADDDGEKSKVNDEVRDMFIRELRKRWERI